MQIFPSIDRSSAVLDKNKEILAIRRKSRPARPPNRESVINWFHTEEKGKKTVFESETCKVASWFHGMFPCLKCMYEILYCHPLVFGKGI